MTRRDFFRWGVRGLVAVLAADAYFLEPKLIRFKEFDFMARENAATPIKIIQLSDLHLREIDDVLHKLARRVNELKPDLICFTGDAIDNARYLSLLDRYLDLFDRDITKIAILGNWEYWGRVNISELGSIYKQHGCQLLINDCCLLFVKNKTILITGVDDFIGGNPDIKTALQNFRDNDFHLVLNHCPQLNDFIIREKEGHPQMDLILSGHTHGGQINLLGFIPILPPGSGKYIKGWYKESQPPVYVSPGIGTSLIPFRLGCRPEATVFNINV